MINLNKYNLMNNFSKILLTILLLLGGGMGLSARAQALNVDELMNIDGISTVYISKSMLEMMPESGIKQKNVDFTAISHKMEGLYLFSANENRQVQMLKSSVLPSLKRGYETLMLVKDKNSESRMVSKRRGNVFENLYMLVDNPNEFVVIAIMGSFTKKDVDQTISKIKKK